MARSSDSDEPRAIETLTRLRQTLRAFVLSKVKDPGLADDIAQETLLRVHAKLDTLRDADRLNAWAFQIARHAIADHLRSVQPSEVFDEQEHEPHPTSPRPELLEAEEEQLRQGVAAYVRSVVAGLPEDYREAIQLVEFEGVPQVELAERLGLSRSAAKSRVQRGRAMVRAEMERCCRWETDRYGAVVDLEPRESGGCDDPCGGS